MKVLFVYPVYPDTFWSFKYVLKITHKKAAYPPLGALTIAAMLPADWEKKVIDLNVSTLKDDDIKWADYVFLSAMAIQRVSAEEVIARCNKIGVKIVAGGALFTEEYEQFPNVDHFILGEGEVTLPLFLKDLEAGSTKRIYLSDLHPEITRTPVPMWSLINLNDYASMSLQYSRGCPFDCEFCDIVVLNGHTPRTKNQDQILSELDSLRIRGWRGSIFIVDDNFIGNKRKLKDEILPAIIRWMETYHYPFSFHTEASVNLAEDTELVDMMVKAGFNAVFLGIETPNLDSLLECNKIQNTRNSLVDSVKSILSHGMEVYGGFIVGFDSDTENIFQNQIDFIQQTGIMTAMVGLLNAPHGTKLFRRMQKEGRLLNRFTGDNMDYSINFVPKMEKEKLINGYNHILSTIYSPKYFYERIIVFLREYKPPELKRNINFTISRIYEVLGAIWILGILDYGRYYWWKLFFTTCIRFPSSIPYIFGFGIWGMHFRKVAEKNQNI